MNQSDIRTDVTPGTPNTPATPGTPGAPGKGGLTGWMMLGLIVALVGAMVWRANAPEARAAVNPGPQVMFGPVTGHEFKTYVEARIAENPELAENSRNGLRLAELAGERPVVEVMREAYLPDLPVKD